MLVPGNMVALLFTHEITGEIVPCSSDLSISKLESAIDLYGLLCVWKVERPPNHLGTFFFFIFLLGVFLQLLKPNIPSFKQHQRSHRNVLCFSINNFLLPTSFAAPSRLWWKINEKLEVLFFVKPFLPMQNRSDTFWQFRSVQRKEKTPGFSHLSDFAEQKSSHFPTSSGSSWP